MNIQQSAGGILIHVNNSSGISTVRHRFLEQASRLGIDRLLETTEEENEKGLTFRIREEFRSELAPGCDTLCLCEKRKLDTLKIPSHLEQEILLAMLLGPIEFKFPSYEELLASVRIRQNIVEAARRTVLSFHTSKIERPADYWTYIEDRGFTLLPGKPLIEALLKATQPEASGVAYSFSCYRATEYVILLSIAKELTTINPALLEQLHHQWESRAIMSGQFHDVFMREYGSMNEPMPPKYYIPGDRLWFRNPDACSSDVTGYEGSWVFYLGNGQFSNFWKKDKP